AVFRKTPRLFLEVPTIATDLEVTINDKKVPREQMQGEILVDPGKAVVRATGKIRGKVLDDEQVVAASPGENIVVSIRLGAAWKDPKIADCLARAATTIAFSECLGRDAASTSPPPSRGFKVDAPETRITARIGSEVSAYHGSDGVDVLSPGIFATI